MVGQVLGCRCRNPGDGDLSKRVVDHAAGGARLGSVDADTELPAIQLICEGVSKVDRDVFVSRAHDRLFPRFAISQIRP